MPPNPPRKASRFAPRNTSHKRDVYFSPILSPPCLNMDLRPCPQDTFCDHLMSPVSSSYHTLEIELVLSGNIYREYLIVNYIKYIIKAFVTTIIYTINNSN